MSDKENWKREFQYLLDRKMLSRDELAYLFGQIKSIIDGEIQKALSLLKQPPCVACGGLEQIPNPDNEDGAKEAIPCPACKGIQPDCSPSAEFVKTLKETLFEACDLLVAKDKTITELEGQLELVEKQCQKNGKSAGDKTLEIDTLHKTITAQADQIKGLEDGLISIRKSTEIMEARRFADQSLKGRCANVG